MVLSVLTYELELRLRLRRRRRRRRRPELLLLSLLLEERRAAALIPLNEWWAMRLSFDVVGLLAETNMPPPGEGSVRAR